MAHAAFVVTSIICAEQVQYLSNVLSSSDAECRRSQSNWWAFRALRTKSSSVDAAAHFDDWKWLCFNRNRPAMAA